MHLVLTSVNPRSRLLEIIVILEGRLILCSWQPSKYPHTCRVEKIVKGKALDKDRFVALSEAVPVILREQLTGKSVREWMDLVGSSFTVEAQLEEL
jgi:hypothetical protein